MCVSVSPHTPGSRGCSLHMARPKPCRWAGSADRAQTRAQAALFPELLPLSSLSCRSRPRGKPSYLLSFKGNPGGTFPGSQRFPVGGAVFLRSDNELGAWGFAQQCPEPPGILTGPSPAPALLTGRLVRGAR